MLQLDVAISDDVHTRRTAGVIKNAPRADLLPIGCVREGVNTI